MSKDISSFILVDVLFNIKKTMPDSKVGFPHRIDDLPEKRFGVSDIEKRKKCCGEILEISPVNSMEHVIDNALQKVVAEHILPTAKYQLVDWVAKQEYVHMNLTYWE